MVYSIFSKDRIGDMRDLTMSDPINSDLPINFSIEFNSIFPCEATVDRCTGPRHKGRIKTINVNGHIKIFCLIDFKI